MSTGWTSAEHPFTIPTDPLLRGQSFFLQAWTFQPGFNAQGVVLSNAVALTLGDI